MPPLSKRRKHIQRLARDESELGDCAHVQQVAIAEDAPSDFDPVKDSALWEGVSSDEESDINDFSDAEDNAKIPEDPEKIEENPQENNTGRSQLTLLDLQPKNKGQTFRYQRGVKLSDRHQRRLVKLQRDLKKAAEFHSQPLWKFIPNIEKRNHARRLAMAKDADTSKAEKVTLALIKLEKKLSSKIEMRKLTPTNLKRHNAVLAFMYATERRPGETRFDIAFNTARSFRAGTYLARKIIQWERMWIEDGNIPESQRSVHSKTKSWLNDEGVHLEVRKQISEMKESKSSRFHKFLLIQQKLSRQCVYTKDITGYKLAQAIGRYLESEKAEKRLQETFKEVENQENPARLTPRARTARRWLKKMGLHYGRFGKGVYFDGHEREDVIEYRQNVFIPRWQTLRTRFCSFHPETMEWTHSIPDPTEPGRKPIIFVTHDESTFNANDGTQYGWFENKKVPIRPKGKGKGIMVSAFLTPGGILKVPDNISDREILNKYPTWNMTGDGKPVREAIQYLEYGKDNYWTGDKMVDHSIQAAKIFTLAFPECQALFAFDNASNHSTHSSDALLAGKMNLNPGGKQPRMRDTWYIQRDNGLKRRQRLIFASTHPKYPNQPKGLKQVLRERRLWRDHDQFGQRFLVACPSECPSDPQERHYKDCCAKTLLANQVDFLAQKGKLEEELTRFGMEVIFYPKFHCELNFIERFWCSAKHHAREKCSYSLEALRQVVPEVLHSVPVETINKYFDRCDRTIEAYRNGLTYDTDEFTAATYNSHRQVSDPSKY